MSDNKNISKCIHILLETFLLHFDYKYFLLNNITFKIRYFVTNITINATETQSQIEIDLKKMFHISFTYKLSFKC